MCFLCFIFVQHYVVLETQSCLHAISAQAQATSQPCGAGAGAGVEPAICLSKLCRPGDIYTPQQRQVDGQQQWITKYQVHGMCLEQDCAQKYARQVQQGMRRPDRTIEQAGRQAGGRVQLGTNYEMSLKVYCTHSTHISALCAC